MLAAPLTQEQTYEAVAEKVRRLGFQAPPRGAWQKRLGALKDSASFEEALRLGAEWREHVNRESLEAEDADS